jgi:hypothetical protein
VSSSKNAALAVFGVAGLGALILVLALWSPPGHAQASNTLDLSFANGAYTVPASVTGGLTQLRLANGDAKTPRSAQLVRYDDGHTAAAAYAEVVKNSNKTVTWVHAEGGLGAVAPKATATATIDLPAGNYLVVDLFGGSSGKPKFASFTVGAGQSAPLPAVSPKVTASRVGKDKYAWKLGGALKTSTKNVTFAAGGTQTLHFLGAFRIKGKHTKAQIIKALKAHGKPPSWIDQKSFYESAVLDGGVSQVTPIALRSKGTYVLFCPLTDKDGGKPHFEEGLLKTVSVR